MSDVLLTAIDANLRIQLLGYAAAVRTDAPASLIARYDARLTAIAESYGMPARARLAIGTRVTYSDPYPTLRDRVGSIVSTTVTDTDSVNSAGMVAVCWDDNPMSSPWYSASAIVALEALASDTARHYLRHGFANDDSIVFATLYGEFIRTADHTVIGTVGRKLAVGDTHPDVTSPMCEVCGYEHTAEGPFNCPAFIFDTDMAV